MTAHPSQGWAESLASRVVHSSQDHLGRTVGWRSVTRRSRRMTTEAEGQMLVSEERLRVLVVDDDPLVRRMIRDVLNPEGILVVGEAEDGRDAVRAARYYKPDVRSEEHTSELQSLTNLVCR